MLAEELVNVRLDRLVTHFAAAAAQDGLRSDRRHDVSLQTDVRVPAASRGARTLRTKMDRGLSQHACISPRVP
jgi:hypothetical protein